MGTALGYYVFMGLLTLVLLLWAFIAFRNDEPRKPE